MITSSRVSSILVLVSDANLNHGDYVLNGAPFLWSTVYGSLSIAQNLLSSGLILWPIECRRRELGAERSQLGLALSVVVETGVTYSLWWIVGVVVYALKSPVFIFFLHLPTSPLLVLPWE